MTVEAWIDDKDLVRRMTLVQSTPQIEGDGITTMKVRMDFFDFGIEPVIEIPASDEVFDATSLAEEGLADH